MTGGIGFQTPNLKTLSETSAASQPLELISTKPARMATRTRKVHESLLDDRINILDGKAAGAPPGAKQVFKTVSDILALVRVGALTLRSSVSS